MRTMFTNGFRLYVAEVLTDRSPCSLSVISSSPVTSMFNAISSPCYMSCLSLTGDICLWESILYYILEHHDLFPCLVELYFHCSPPPSSSTHYTFYYIPTSLDPPFLALKAPRCVHIFIYIPVVGTDSRPCDVRRFYIRWNLSCPSKSSVVTTV